MSFMAAMKSMPKIGQADAQSIPSAMPGTSIASKARSTPTVMAGPDFGPGSAFDVLGLGRFDAQPNFKSRAGGGVLSNISTTPTQFQPSTNNLSQFQRQSLLQSMPNYFARG